MAIAKLLKLSRGKKAVTVDASDMTESDDHIQVHPLTLSPNQCWKRMKGTVKSEKMEYLSPKSRLGENCLRFVCLSDTHSRVEGSSYLQQIPPGDVLLHAGDFTQTGQERECVRFNQFLKLLPHKFKIVIAGNHEMCLDSRQYKFTGDVKSEIERIIENCLSEAIYVQDSMVTICGIKIYGVPWMPIHGYPAFGLTRGRELLEKYDQIPSDVDILLSHGPPLGFNDHTSHFKHAGCVELLTSVQKRINPKYVISGHIHEGYGQCTDGNTVFINASVCSRAYKPVHKPIIFDIPLPAPYTREDFLGLSARDIKMQSL